MKLCCFDIFCITLGCLSSIAELDATGLNELWREEKSVRWGGATLSMVVVFERTEVVFEVEVLVVDVERSGVCGRERG